MNEYKELSLIKIAEKVLKADRLSVPKTEEVSYDLYELFDKVVELKGIELDNAAQTLNEFYAELSASAKFVYAGDNAWDLKAHRSIDNWDKDGSDYSEYKEVHDESMDARIATQKEKERKHQEMLEERERIAEEKAEHARLMEEQAKEDGTIAEVDAMEEDSLEDIGEEFHDATEFVSEEEVDPEKEKDKDILETSEEDYDEDAEEDDKYLEYLDDYEDEYDK